MSTEHIRKVKDEVHSMFLNNPYGASQVAIGCKQSGGAFSEEKCIRFGVDEKLPIDQIPEEKRIPSTITIDGVEYKTDVYRSGGQAKISALLIAEDEAKTQALQPEVQKINGIPVGPGGSSGSVQTFLSDPNYGLNCRYWLYTNTNTGSVNISYTHCRNYTATDTVPSSWNQFYIIATGGGYTPPDFPNMTKQIDDYIEDYVCCSDSKYPTTDTPSIRIVPNRSKKRPLRGGISMMAPPPTGYVAAGTLGGIVVDSTDGKMVGLTNNHVCGNPGGSVDNSKFFANDTYAATDASYRNINVYQPSSLDTMIVNNPTDLLGKTKRVYPFTSTGTNYVDAGIVNLSDSSVDTGSWNAISSSFASAPTFASTAEIDALTTSNDIFKSGRTTGATNIDFYDEFSNNTNKCVIRITNTSTSISVAGYIGASPGISINFADLLQLESPYPNNTIVGQAGDSGSLVYAKIGGVWKVIGLFFAGNGLQGWACRIDRVANLLKLQAYTGSAVNADPNTATYTTLDYATYGSQVSASIGGKTYWQVGKNF